MHDQLIVTPEVCVMHVAVFKAVNSPLAPLRYKKKLTVMLEKGHPADEEFRLQYLRRLKEMIASFPGGQPDLRAVSFGDGDAPFKQGKSAGKVDPRTQGYWLLRPWCEPEADLPLRYYDGQEYHEATTSSHIYSGCFGRVCMKMFPYTKGTPGIALGLAGFTKTADGERMDNAITSSDVLDAMGVGPSGMRAAEVISFPEITDAAMRETLGLQPL